MSEEGHDCFDRFIRPFHRHKMTGPVKTPEDLPRRLGLRALGALPYRRSLKKRKDLALPAPGRDDGKRQDAEVLPLYDISSRFPTTLRLSPQAVSGHVFMVESATRDEGKSTVLASLAASLAGGGFRVLMVDCDLQRRCGGI